MAKGKKKSNTQWDEEAQSERWAAICKTARGVDTPNEITVTEFEAKFDIGRMSQSRYEAGGAPKTTRKLKEYGRKVLGVGLAELDAMLDGKTFAPAEKQSLEEWAESFTDLRFTELCKALSADQLVRFVAIATNNLMARIKP